MSHNYYAFKCRATVTIEVEEYVHGTPEEHAEELFIEGLQYEYGEFEVIKSEVTRLGDRLTEYDKKEIRGDE